MARLISAHRVVLDDLLAALDKAMKPDIVPTSGYLQQFVLDALRPLIEPLADEPKKGETLVKNTLPHFWREISDLITSRYPKDCTPFPRHEISRIKRKWDAAWVQWDLFRVDHVAGVRGATTSLYEQTRLWREAATVRWKDEVQTRESYKFQWGQPEYDALYNLAIECLDTPMRSRSDSEICVRLIFALSFFTGRRPWEEVGRISVFSEAEPPDDLPDVEHADDWLQIDGLASKGYLDSIVIPVYGISSERLVEGLRTLRWIETGKSWFDPTVKPGSDGSKNILSSLDYQWRKFVQAEVMPIFERCLEAGYDFAHNESKTKKSEGSFSAYDCRRLYASYGHARYNEYVSQIGPDGKVIGSASDNIQDYIKLYLGHSEKSDDKVSATYSIFTFVGDQPLRPVNRKGGRFDRRSAYLAS